MLESNYETRGIFIHSCCDSEQEKKTIAYQTVLSAIL